MQRSIVRALRFNGGKRHFGSHCAGASSDLVVDLSLRDGGNRLCETLSTVGVAVVVGHGIPNEVLEQVSVSARQFFSLNKNVKNEVHVAKGGTSWSGYMPHGGEATHGVLDQKQGFYLTGQRDPSPLLGPVLTGPLLWPKELVAPTFRSSHETAMKYLGQFGYKVTSMLSQHCGYDLTSKMLHNHDAIELYRSFAYNQTNGSGVGPHSDYGYITILTADAPGLQYRLEERPDAEFVDIPFVKNGLVVSAGDLLDVVTGGMYKSRVHRVIVRNGSCTSASGISSSEESNRICIGRHSFILFFDPSPAFLVEPLVKDRIDTSDEALIRWNRTAFASVARQSFGSQTTEPTPAASPYALFLAKKLEKVLGQRAPEFAAAPSVSTRFQISLSGDGHN